MEDSLIVNSSLMAYLSYLLSNRESYTEDSGFWHQDWISKKFTDANEKHLEKLVSMGILSEVWDEPDVDFTGIKEQESFLAGYELTDFGEEVVKKLKRRDSSLKRWLKLCYLITDTPQDKWLLVLIPVWMYEGYHKLTKSYCKEERVYHNLNHVVDCLDEFRVVHQLAEHPNEIEFAIWFHDAIYNIKGKDNEEKSAVFAGEVMESASLPDRFKQRVVNLILVTKHAVAPTDPDTRLLVDIDLSILGQAEDKFDEYERQIRKEYEWVSEGVFVARRSAILKSFLDRPTIYSTLFFHDKYEVQARRNIARSLARLRA